jgi:hypothetical protein
MQNTWTTVFGFKPVQPSKKQRIKSLNLLIMNETGLLEKRLLPTQTVDGQITTKTGLNTKLFQEKFSLFRYCDAVAFFLPSF